MRNVSKPAVALFATLFAFDQVEQTESVLL